MPIPGPWIDQDDLIDATFTLTGSGRFYDDPNGWASASIDIGPIPAVRWGSASEDATTDPNQAWEWMRGADPNGTPPTEQLGGTPLQGQPCAVSIGTAGSADPPFWHPDDALHASAGGPVLQPAFVADNDPDLGLWPAGAIDVEYEGPQIYDAVVSVSADAVTAATGLTEPALILDPGSFSLVAIDASFFTDDSAPASLSLGGATSLTVADGTEVDPLVGSTRSVVVMVPDLVASGLPSLPDLGDYATYLWAFEHLAYTATFSVIRPRYRWIFAGGQAPPCQIYPRDDDQGAGTAAIWPPASSGRPGSYY